jgi:hypothetical protein
MNFTDNTTGKQYSINGNTVTQARNGVVLAVATMDDVQGWMDMMGFAVATPKMSSYVVQGIKSRNKVSKNYWSIIRVESVEQAVKIAKKGTQGLIDVKVMTVAEWDAIKKQS